MPHTSSHNLQRSAGEQEWQALRVVIYPWPDGLYLALERRDGVGGSHRDTRLLAGPISTGHTFDAHSDLGDLLRAASKALADAADRTDRTGRARTDSPA